MSGVDSGVARQVSEHGGVDVGLQRHAPGAHLVDHGERLVQVAAAVVLVNEQPEDVSQTDGAGRVGVREQRGGDALGLVRVIASRSVRCAMKKRSRA